MTGHIGTNTPKFVPLRRGRPRFDPTQTGLCMGLELSEETKTITQCYSGKEKSAQILTFWVRRPPSGAGVFHAKGWGSKSSCPPWVSKGGTWDVPGIVPGCPLTP